MNLEEISSEYNTRKPMFSSLMEEALFILNKRIKDAGIKLHSITSRIKELDSFFDKAQDKQINDPFNEIKDIVGTRIVCLFLTDINKIGDIIRDSFTILTEDNKIDGSDISSFGYMSFHFIAKMKAEYCGPRYDAIANMPFEIQVRTIAMDAWANVSHYLSYKSENDVPSNLKRDFHALSGLFYVADKHFELFYDASKQSREAMEEMLEDTPKLDESSQEINLDSMNAYIHKKFPDRDQTSSKITSALISELAKARYKTIGEIDKIVDSSSKAFEEYEIDNPPSPGRAGIDKYSSVGVIRISVSIYDTNFTRFLYGDRTSEDEIAERQEKLEKYRKLLKGNPKGKRKAKK